LGTLVSGAYVEMDPGDKGTIAKEFVGLELPPLVRAETRGKTFDLKAEKLGSFSFGSPIYYRGFKAGQVLGFELEDDNKTVTVHIFINEPYDALVREHSRFWNVSGVRVTVDANGMDLRTESLETLLQGGLAFDTPATLETGPPAKEGTIFALFADDEAVEKASFVERERVIAYFDGSVRGLSVDAPVEFRGIKVGSVVDVKMEFDRSKMAFRIPVLIEFESGRISVIGERFDNTRQAMKALIDMGMRAQLQTGSLLTGQLFVGLDLFPDTPAKLVGADERYPEMPTIPSTIEAITASLTGLLDRVAALPIEELVADLRQAVEGAKNLLSSPETQQAMQNLTGTLARAETLMQTLDTEVGPLVSSLRSTSDAAGLAMVQARSTLASAESLTGEQSPLRHDLSSLFEELRRAARSIRVLADYLQNHPEALLGGKTR
jgi:paraquat-inducible protein B